MTMGGRRSGRSSGIVQKPVERPREQRRTSGGNGRGASILFAPRGGQNDYFASLRSQHTARSSNVDSSAGPSLLQFEILSETGALTNGEPPSESDVAHPRVSSSSKRKPVPLVLLVPSVGSALLATAVAGS